MHFEINIRVAARRGCQKKTKRDNDAGKCRTEGAFWSETLRESLGAALGPLGAYSGGWLTLAAHCKCLSPLPFLKPQAAPASSASSDSANLPTLNPTGPTQSQLKVELELGTNLQSRPLSTSRLPSTHHNTTTATATDDLTMRVRRSESAHCRCYARAATSGASPFFIDTSPLPDHALR